MSNEGIQTVGQLGFDVSVVLADRVDEKYVGIKPSSSISAITCARSMCSSAVSAAAKI